MLKRGWKNMKVIAKKGVIVLMILSMLFGMVPIARAEGIDLNSVIPDAIDVKMVDPGQYSTSSLQMLFNEYLVVDYINEIKEKDGGNYEVTFVPMYIPAEQSPTGTSGFYKGNFYVKNYGENCPEYGCLIFHSKDVSINYAKGTEANIKRSEAIGSVIQYRSYTLLDMDFLKNNNKPELLLEKVKSIIPADLGKYAEVKTSGCGNSLLDGGCDVDVIVKIDDIYYKGYRINYGWEPIMFVPVGTNESDYETTLLKRLKEEFPNDSISITKNKTLLEYADNDKNISQQYVNKWANTYRIKETSMVYDLNFNDYTYSVFIVPSNIAMNYKIDNIIKDTGIKFPSVPLDKVSTDTNISNDYLAILSDLYFQQYKNDKYSLQISIDLDENGDVKPTDAYLDLYVWDYFKNEYGDYGFSTLVESKKVKISFTGVYDESISAKLEDAMEKIKNSKDFIVNDLNYIQYSLDNTTDSFYFDDHIYTDEFKKLNLDEKIYVKYYGRAGDALPFFSYSFGTYLLAYGGIYYKYLDSGPYKGTAVHDVLFVPEGTDKKDYAAVLEYRIKQEYPNSKVSVVEKEQTMQEYVLEKYGEVYLEDIQNIAGKMKENGYEENLTLYEVTVDDLKETVLISANKDIVLKPISTKDEETGVVVESDEMNVPEDVKVEVKIVDRNDPKLKDAQEIIKNDKIKAYDISLNSESEGQITKTKAGKFQVTIPLGKESVGKHYVAYFIDSEGKIQRHVVKVDKEGNATFKTNHFSRYIISEEELVVGDLNYNKQVDLTDVLLMLKIYFNSVDVDEYTEYVADINENNSVDLTDVLILLKEYFKQS